MSCLCQEKTRTDDRDWRCTRRGKEKHGEGKDVGRGQYDGVWIGRIFGMNKKGHGKWTGVQKNLADKVIVKFQINVVDDNNMYKYISINWVHLRNIIVILLQSYYNCLSLSTMLSLIY
jgi:hypothetical protein